MKRLITPAFFMVLALLALSELGARTFFAKDFSGRFAYGYDPQAGFAEYEDGTVELFRAGGRRFHPQSFMRQRSSGTFRIFVVGDSVPRGPGFREAYPWYLGEELRRHQVEAECINLAVPGYGARRCQIVLKKALEFDPSLIILHLNDSNKWEDDREWRRSQEFQGWHPRHWPMKIFIFRRLYEAKLEKVFWALVPEEVRAKYAANDADAKIATSLDPREMAARARVARETTGESVELVRRCHVPILLVTQCRVERNGSQAMCLMDHGLDALGDSLAGPGVGHVSMKKVFSGTDLESCFADSGHLRKSGHQLLARAICEKIQAEQANLGLQGFRMAEGPGWGKGDGRGAPRP